MFPQKVKFLFTEFFFTDFHWAECLETDVQHISILRNVLRQFPLSEIPFSMTATAVIDEELAYREYEKRCLLATSYVTVYLAF